MGIAWTHKLCWEYDIVKLLRTHSCPIQMFNQMLKTKFSSIEDHKTIYCKYII
jgi:hypothetical protein